MSVRTVALDERLYQYLLQIGLTESETMAKLRAVTAMHKQAKMQLAPEQGQFLRWLARLMGVRRYLELGVFTGYSTLAIAEVLPPDGEVVACDVSEAFTDIARQFWREAGVEDRIRLVLQPALLTLESLLEEGRVGAFDLALIDADKPNKPAYFEACLKLVRPGGVIAIDNVFLGGRVVEPKAEDPLGVQVMHAFNAALKHDERVDIVVLPFGDGLTLATVK